MLSKHAVNYYGLGMDALVTICSRNTNVILVWAWMPERSRTALCCPATKHCENGHKIAAWQVHETPRMSAKLSSYNPLKTARFHQAREKNQYACGGSVWMADPQVIARQGLTVSDRDYFRQPVTPTTCT